VTLVVHPEGEAISKRTREALQAEESAAMVSGLHRSSPELSLEEFTGALAGVDGPRHPRQGKLERVPF